VDWLKDWPCIRNFGLGTRLPFDDRFVIEPLSDSTIYMAFYTISHLLKGLDAEKLNEDFFNYVFRNEGTSDGIAEKTGIKKNKLDTIKKSFDYWYPLDWRCSASELIGNHLTFMVFHHTALFPNDKWPQGIVAFGMGLLEGQKMSSSKGNVVLLKEAIDKFGADVVRLFLMSNAEPWQDFDWRENEVVGAQKALSKFKAFADSLGDMEEGKETNIDRWLLSKLQSIKGTVNISLEGFQTRKALQAGFFEVFPILRWYERRGGKNKKILLQFLGEWTRLMAPFTPYIAEEVWSKIGKGFVLDAEYPQPDETKLDKRAEAGETLLGNLIGDVEKIVEMTGKKPKVLSVYIADDWKYELFELFEKGAQIGDAMKEERFKKHGKEVVSLFKKSKEMAFAPGWKKEDEDPILREAKAFLEKELDCSVKINPEEDPQNKARFALPMKPAIYLE
jgi:leucyl-tRNA synthetase